MSKLQPVIKWSGSKRSQAEQIVNLIKQKPIFVFETYERLWNELNKDNDLERKKQYFAQIREEFNKTHKPELFLFPRILPHSVQYFISFSVC